MPRLVLLPVLLLALLGPVSAASARPPRVAVTSCDRLHQSAVFEGRMDTIPKAEQLQMRFRLQVLSPSQPVWRNLNVPSFSAWVTSDPGRSRYVYAKRLEALLAPSSYRVQVRFRWLDASGATLRTAKVTSRSCRQPDPRADLRVAALSLVEPGRYDVALRNAGRADAPATTVELWFPNASTAVADVPPMAPGDREDVFVSGPRCAPGSWITAQADASDVVDERDEANTFTLPCPSA